VTGQSVAHRVANARNDPTFLLADVEVVAEYQLFNINRSKMEGLIHKAWRRPGLTWLPVIASAGPSSRANGS
jgi:hypothetical protein